MGFMQHLRCCQPAGLRRCVLGGQLPQRLPDHFACSCCAAYTEVVELLRGCHLGREYDRTGAIPDDGGSDLTAYLRNVAVGVGHENC